MALRASERRPGSGGTWARIGRGASPSVFALAALAFLLPFASVSCDEAHTSVTGVQLVAHTVPAGGNLDSLECSGDIAGCEEGSGSGWAAVALAAAALGIVLGVLGIACGPGSLALVGLVALACIGGNAISSEADVTFHQGYGLALAGFAAAACLNIVRFWQRSRRRLAEAEACGSPQSWGLVWIASPARSKPRRRDVCRGHRPCRGAVRLGGNSHETVGGRRCGSGRRKRRVRAVPSLRGASATLRVCSSGCAFAAIGDALAVAEDDDTIEIAPGTYGGFSISRFACLTASSQTLDLRPATSPSPLV